MTQNTQLTYTFSMSRIYYLPRLSITIPLLLCAAASRVQHTAQILLLVAHLQIILLPFYRALCINSIPSIISDELSLESSKDTGQKVTLILYSA